MSTLVKIYQLDIENNNIFADFSEERFNFSDYHLVYSCVRPRDYIPDNAFYEFNMNKPEDFRGHSISVSDIVEINNKKFYCDSFGWARV